MPKEGRSRVWWCRRLSEFAAGSAFGRGEMPGQGTWARQQVEGIRLCPAHYGASSDGRGQPIRCRCNWHKPADSRRTAPGAAHLGGRRRTPGAAHLGGRRRTPGAAHLGGRRRTPGAAHLGGRRRTPGAAHLGGRRPRSRCRFEVGAHSCRSLMSKGPYRRVRRVLDASGWYYLAGEYHSCGQCAGTFVSYDHRLLRQLPDGRRGLFPAVLTHKLACDRDVVVSMRGRTLGNSPTACRNRTAELHDETWGALATAYYDDVRRHREGAKALRQAPISYDVLQRPPAVPSAAWFLACHVNRGHRLTELTPPGHEPLLPNYRAPREYTGELIGLDLLGTQSELGVPTEMELLDAAIDQLTDEQVAAAADDGEAPDDLEAATAAPLDADESDSGDSDGTAYGGIRTRIMWCRELLEMTGLQLYPINETTLITW
ncbi:hypothetical protein FJT64_012479 [Amphibalanus amphitrite]|uniref:DUF6729 domain-containing protein n=1 Tax=Amphibalanus amphitrite TaxID=1232801 RepID=A0A6A4UZB1_AMPAM|nr:hypothetical protein FJT64_012479 [Amphibalanus amphitrite]